MAQTQALINTLKQTLKAHGKTYADVAAALNLHEASIKRLFAAQRLSLERLDQICQFLGIEISDLVAEMQANSHQLQQLSHEQELQIASDIELLLITVCVLNKWTLPEILDHYTLSEQQCIQKLAQLDRLKIIDLLPHNRIKLLLAPNFKWLEGGPIQKFFQQRVERDFFSTQFSNQNEKLAVVNGMLSSASNALLQRKMAKLMAEFNELNRQDCSLPLEQRHGTTFVLALRQWQFGLFEHLTKKPSK